MKAQNIRVGACLALTPEAKRRYDISAERLTVLRIETTPGYKTPWIACQWGANAGYFRPSDFKREVPSCV